LTVLFFCRLKNKPIGGIAFPAFILGAGGVTNSLFLTSEPGKKKKKHQAN
jgi:hypothetical protein